MASVRKQGNKYFVYYYHPLLKKADGKPEQMYEDFPNEDLANKRKSEIEYKIKTGYFKAASSMTVNDFFNDKYIPLYASVKWKYKTYDTNMGIWNNDILPFFGKMSLSKVLPADIERFLAVMRSKKVRNMPKTPEAERPYISETTVRYTFTLVHCFFKKAVQWDDLEKTPVKCDKPALSTKKRDFWQPERFAEALADIDDELLHLAIHLAFRCNLRIGEVCALTWENINYDDLTVSIIRNIQRVTLKALDRKDKREVFYVFPAQQKKSKSRLILTTPKSDCGTRTNTMSVQLSEELHQRQLKVAMDRVRHGKKYNDYDLVFCHTDGHPVDTKWLSRQFTKWQKKHKIGDVGTVDFHSIRHSSTSAQLIMSGGDIMSVQKMSGHKTAHMVLGVYGRSVDSQYASMNKNFDEFIYGNVDTQKALQNSFNNDLLLQIITEELKKPEFLEQVLKSMSATNSSGAKK